MNHATPQKNLHPLKVGSPGSKRSVEPVRKAFVSTHVLLLPLLTLGLLMVVAGHLH